MLRCLCKNKYITNDITATLSNNIAIFRRLDSADINSFSPHKIKKLYCFCLTDFLPALQGEAFCPLNPHLKKGEEEFQADLLPVLKGEGSPRTDHRFVVYRLHFHHLIAGGITHPAPFIQR
jgi:hypothetical protein